jgi:glutaredoxin 3
MSVPPPYNLSMVTIFGKDTCPYTQRAREDYEGRGVKVEYINVKKNPAELERMLGYSKGRRDVPVIVEGDRVTIGFGGT